MDNNGYRLLLPEGTLDYFMGQCKNLRGNICKNPIFA